MTKEHAAEVILEGRPWMECIQCSNGYRVEDNDDYTVCQCCFGSGKLLRMEYEEACQILNIPLPKTGKEIYFSNIQNYHEMMKVRRSRL